MPRVIARSVLFSPAAVLIGVHLNAFFRFSLSFGLTLDMQAAIDFEVLDLMRGQHGPHGLDPILGKIPGVDTFHLLVQVSLPL